MLYVANVGDSRCVLATGGKQAFAMTTDHLPRSEPEAARIHRAGGNISHDGRLNYDINMSRSFGNLRFLVLPVHDQYVCTGWGHGVVEWLTGYQPVLASVKSLLRSLVLGRVTTQVVSDSACRVFPSGRRQLMQKLFPPTSTVQKKTVCTGS